MFDNVLLIILYILLGVLGIFLLAVLFSYIAALIVPEKEFTTNSKFYRFLLNSWTKFMVFILQIKLHVSGLDKVPNNERFLIVSNHRSNYDPILTWYVLKKYDIAFISKASNFKIPFFGKFIRKCCFMAIDRENPRNAIKTINNASQLLINNTVSVGVYPEGTRSKTDEMLDFHNGVFKIAKKANVPVVIMTIKGTWNIYKNIPFKKTDVDINFVDILSKDEISSLSTSEISTIVRNKIEENL